ncbi:MAG: chromate transporter, partial [Clostridiales bacterium]|nr:chromate transporter [Clostridiales bacterium]
MIILRLFAEFFLIGLLAFGGGMATIPFLQDLSERTGWFTAAQLTDMIAISEATPGPIGINLATYAGYNTAGIPGVLSATFGIVTPSVVVIIIVAKVLEKFRENEYVDSAFYGLRPASCALICSSALTLLRSAIFTP